MGIVNLIMHTVATYFNAVGHIIVFSDTEIFIMFFLWSIKSNRNPTGYGGCVVNTVRQLNSFFKGIQFTTSHSIIFKQNTKIHVPALMEVKYSKEYIYRWNIYNCGLFLITGTLTNVEMKNYCSNLHRE